MGLVRLQLTPLNRSPEHAKAACNGKIAYRYVKDARKEGNRLIREAGVRDPISVYRCEFCNRYHVGKSTRTILARLRVVSPA